MQSCMLEEVNVDAADIRIEKFNLSQKSCLSARQAWFGLGFGEGAEWFYRQKQPECLLIFSTAEHIKFGWEQELWSLYCYLLYGIDSFVAI